MVENITQQITAAANIIQKSGVIAYPTEGVYGFGCDPFNKIAVEKLLFIKQRSVTKGLIIIAADWKQVAALVNPFPKLISIIKVWPANTTYLFPASEQVPAWIKGEHTQIAIRISQFSLVRELCAQAGPLVSTSANIQGEETLIKVEQVRENFSGQLDFIIDAAIGNLHKATAIIEAETGKVIRA
jgi:L-threonylcarbamoyladenylate synthase